MRSSSSQIRRELQVFRSAVLTVCLFLSFPVFATKGVFQGMVVEGTKHEAGKYIYIAAPNGSMRRVNIQNCRVRFAPGVQGAQRGRSATESLRDNTQVRVTAEQTEKGEWIATDILILKLPLTRQDWSFRPMAL
jgi:hypothetical protein